MPQIIPPPIISSDNGSDFLLSDYELEELIRSWTYPSEQLSNCCGATILMPDSNGHGRCAECKENCVPEEMD